MKRTVDDADESASRSEYSLPEELWMVVLGNVFDPMYLSEFLLCGSVSVRWRKMVNASVTCIGYCDSDSLNDDILARFGSLQDLTLRDIYDSRGFLRRSCVTDGGLRLATNITRLDLRSCSPITDFGISSLFKLRTLHLSDKVTDMGVMHLTNLTYLASNANVSDESFLKLTNLTRLEVPNGSCITGIGLAALTNLSSLNAFIRMSECCYDDGLKRLTNLKRLCFSASQHNVTDDGLKDLVNLEHLAVDRGYFSDVAIRHLTNLVSLLFSVRSYQITDDGISNLCKLSTITLDGFPLVTDFGLRHLVNLTDLRLEPHFSDTGVSALTNLQSLYLGDNLNLTNASISRMTRLKNLNLGKNTIIDDRGILGLINLESLVIHADNSVSYEGVKMLTNLKIIGGLEHLNLDRSDAAKIHRELPNLLHIAWPRIQSDDAQEIEYIS